MSSDTFNYKYAVGQANADGCYEWMRVCAGRPSTFSNNLPADDPAKATTVALTVKGAIDASGVQQSDWCDDDTVPPAGSTRRFHGMVSACGFGSAGVAKIVHRNGIQFGSELVQTPATMAGEIPAPSGGTGYFQQGNILVNPVCDRYLDVTFQLLLPSPRFTVLGPQNGSNLNNTYYDTEQYTTGATGVGPPLEKVGRQRYKLVFRFNPVIQCFDKEGNQIHTNIAATPQDFLFPAPSGQLQSFDKFLFDGTGPDRPCEYQVVSCFVRPSPDRGVVVGCESCVEVELHIVGMAPKRNDNQTLWGSSSDCELQGASRRSGQLELQFRPSNCEALSVV
jgi:hypothetical protein